VSEAAGLTHFRTRLSVALAAPADLNALVRRLHPTPAVGVLPRDEASLARLMDYRKQLGAPAFFGAPFGLKVGDTFHCVVAIRGIGWNGREVLLPSGCGIVGGSAFDHEWRELRLKRESVATLLGV
jgi:menaquinone-specific isochorismate synthase